MYSDMTAEEKDRLIKSVADLTARDVLKRDDMVRIMQVCSEACSRRIEEIEGTLGAGLKNVQ